jgi:prolyl oligopeptidase
MRGSIRYLFLMSSVLLWAAAPPPTPKKPVIDEYHGVKVTDDYRWLEDAKDPAVRAWADAQNRYTRSYLDALPIRKTVFGELERLYNYPSPRYRDFTYRGGKLFGLIQVPPKEQPSLAVFDSADSAAMPHLIVDPAQIDPTGHTAIDFYVPSLDGKRVAVSMSQGGSESGDLHVYEVATAKALPDVIARVNGGTAGGSVTWNADGSGFYYTRYPRAGERPAADLGFYQQVWFHRLGAAPASDQYSLGKDFPRIAEILLQSSDDGRYILARMANGDGGEASYHLLGPEGRWMQIAGLADSIADAGFGADGSIYLLSHQNAPMGRILRIAPGNPKLAAAQTVVPESNVAIQAFVPAASHLYVADVVGGPSQIRVFDLAGHSQGMVPLETVSAVRQILRYGRDEILYQNVSYVRPASWFRFNPSSKQAVATAFRETSAAGFSDAEVTREMATSKDGTKVPLTIIRRKGTKLDGTNPTLLYGYGGYAVNVVPQFSVELRPMLDRGMVYAVANLRGGGEFGEAWHRAGMLTRKQNVFDDFAACAQYLIDKKFTSASHLAIEGGSNGGLLMGAELTQHPGLFRAVVSFVGIYDMLRVELSPNGAFNVTEFGTTKEPDQFRALYAYSPYHHVINGTQYPAVLFLTGDNDPRVDPMNSRKMTARLQATGTRLPVLLRTSSTSGHGIGTSRSEQVAQNADALAFLFDQLGVK